MQKRDRKRYSREFKLEAVRRTQITGKSAAEVARELIIFFSARKDRHPSIA